MIINANPAAPVGRIFTSPGPVYEPHFSENDNLWACAFFRITQKIAIKIGYFSAGMI